MTTWGAGDYPLMAARLMGAALAAVDLAAVGPGDRVLDVATGTGNAALLAADRGGHVVGVDTEPMLLREAGERARKAGQQVGWAVGDAVALPVGDESADVVLSVFGVMYAPDHLAAARELARVAAPGARLALASWVPGSTMPAMSRVLTAYLPPPPPGTGPPSAWGDADMLATLLEPCGLQLAGTSTRRLHLAFPDVSAAVDFLVRTAGHVVSEQQRLIRAGRWHHLCEDLGVFVAQRCQRDGDRVELPLDYLLALAARG